MPDISTILRNAVLKDGVIPFSEFMNTALYCPTLGYYERSDRGPGRHSDFITSVSIGPLFGELLAIRFARWLSAVASPCVDLVEAGAHDGQLAMDILSSLEHREPALLERIDYWLVEPSLARRRWQSQILSRYADKIKWCDSMADLDKKSVSGVIFSNELLDAFPVVRLRWNALKQQWAEMGVAVDDEGFVWRDIERPADWAESILDDARITIPPELAAVIPDGFIIDVSPAAGQWWRSAAAALGFGRLVTVDYGLTALELLSPGRREGTLRAYRKQHVLSDPLNAPGEQDLTSHVNFCQLQHAGETAGLRTEALISQAQFLTPIAEEHWLGNGGTTANPRTIRAFQTLTHPEHLGHRFKVLVQATH